MVDKLSQTMINHGFFKCNGDSTNFYKHAPIKSVVLQIYMYNIFIICSDQGGIAQIEYF